jgi:enoyl-CoA hydratase
MALLKTLDTNGVLFVTLSRPDALNALNAETMDGLREIMQETYQSNEIKGLIFIGEGEKAFVAGADIKELSALNKEQALKLAQKGQELFKMIENCPKPVIAAINGFALGGGCELAMGCHIRIASENAKFGQPEVNLGTIPGFGGTQRITQILGRGKALELLLTGDLISAAEAKTLGLVNHIVPNREDLITTSKKMMAKILGKGPVAVANIIKTVNAGFEFENRGYEAEAKSFSECVSTEDFKEGTKAFIEKRPANFKGK